MERLDYARLLGKMTEAKNIWEKFETEMEEAMATTEGMLVW